MEMFQSAQKQLVERLLSEPALEQRVERLMSIRAVGPITALTWALEIADPHRFASIADAVSYCGLSAAFRSSAGKQQRGPISKQRNAWLQPVLIEAAKLAPRWNPQLAALHAHALERGHPNRATLQVARKLVAYCWLWTRVASPFRYTFRHHPKHREKEEEQERTKRELFWRRPLKENTAPVGGSYRQVRGDRTGQCEFSEACRSISRWSLCLAQHKGESRVADSPQDTSVG